MQKKGFTLIELVVVMAIIAVLSVLIIGAITVARRSSTETVHRGNARTLQTAFEEYHARKKQYPGPPPGGTSYTNFRAIAYHLGLGIGSEIKLADTPECDSTPGQGGGSVAYTSLGYQIIPYDWTCTVPLTNDAIRINF